MKNPPDIRAAYEERNGKKNVLVIYVAKATDMNRFFQVDRRTVHDWIDKGMPRLDNGHFDLYECFQWWHDNIAAKPKKAEESEAQRLKHKRMEQQYRSGELSYAKEIQMVVPKPHVEWFLDTVATHYQKLGQRLARKFGKQAGKLVDDTNRTIERLVSKELG